MLELVADSRVGGNWAKSLTAGWGEGREELGRERAVWASREYNGVCVPGRERERGRALFSA